MSRETLEFLAWLVRQQTINLSAPDAREMSTKVFRVLDEIEAELARVPAE